MSNKAVNVSKKDVFAVHNGFFYDNRLSFEEIGLLAYMLSLSDDYDFSVEKLSEERKISINSISRALSKLSKYGYYRKIRLVDRHGKFVDWEHEVTDVSHPEWINADNIALAE